MKYVCITYRMERKREVAETCAILPMTDEKADELLAEQAQWRHLADGATLDVLLHKLAIIQGYHFVAFAAAEPVVRPFSGLVEGWE